jgi:hypothetical protein
MKKEMRSHAARLFLTKEGGAEVFSDVYAGTSFYWELATPTPMPKSSWTPR